MKKGAKIRKIVYSNCFPFLSFFVFFLPETLIHFTIFYRHLFFFWIFFECIHRVLIKWCFFPEKRREQASPDQIHVLSRISRIEKWLVFFLCFFFPFVFVTDGVVCLCSGHRSFFFSIPHASFYSSLRMNGWVNGQMERLMDKWMVMPHMNPCISATNIFSFFFAMCIHILFFHIFLTTFALWVFIFTQTEKRNQKETSPKRKTKRKWNKWPAEETN